MAAYKIIEVDVFTGRITTTDLKIVQWVLTELRKIIPTVDLQDSHGDLETGDIITTRFKKLEDKDGAALSWIIRRLCETGWEPYAVRGGFTESGASTGEGFSRPVYYFRKHIK